MNFKCFSDQTGFTDKLYTLAIEDVILNRSQTEVLLDKLCKAPELHYSHQTQKGCLYKLSSSLFSMTQLLSHTVAHFTGPSFML